TCCEEDAGIRIIRIPRVPQRTCDENEGMVFLSCEHTESISGSTGATKWNRRDAFAARRTRLEPGAGLIGPGSLRRILEIQDPLLAGREAFAALFEGQRQIEMHVRVG